MMMGREAEGAMLCYWSRNSECNDFLKRQSREQREGDRGEVIIV